MRFTTVLKDDGLEGREGGLLEVVEEAGGSVDCCLEVGVEEEVRESIADSRYQCQ